MEGNIVFNREVEGQPSRLCISVDDATKKRLVFPKNEQTIPQSMLLNRVSVLNDVRFIIKKHKVIVIGH